MSKNNSWLILNVSEEAREEAKKKAKLEKKTIGEWLSAHITEEKNIHTNYDEKNKNKDLNLLVSIADNISTEIDELKLGMKAIYNKLDELKREKGFFGKFLG